jgi:hypothetical protein
VAYLLWPVEPATIPGRPIYRDEIGSGNLWQKMLAEALEAPEALLAQFTTWCNLRTIR